MSSPNPYHATGLVHFIPPKNISVDKFKFIAPVFFGSLILLPPPVGKQKKGAQNQNACTIKTNSETTGHIAFVLYNFKFSFLMET